MNFTSTEETKTEDILIFTAKNCVHSEILSYLQVNKLVCYCSLILGDGKS